MVASRPLLYALIRHSGNPSVSFDLVLVLSSLSAPLRENTQALGRLVAHWCWHNMAFSEDMLLMMVEGQLVCYVMACKCDETAFNFFGIGLC